MLNRLRTAGAASRHRWLALALTALLVLPIAAACSDDDDETTITVYSGRSEALIGPLLEQFAEDTGIDVAVRYGGSAELAATLREEADADTVRADVFIAQDAGALGAVQRAGILAELPQATLDRVDPAYRSPSGEWVGVSGRARVLVYSTDTIAEAELPDSILDLTGPEWRGRIGWAPANGSFQAWVTALRLTLGEDDARAWLEAIRDNGVTEYPNNSSIVEAVGRGEVEIGLVNHYYLSRFIAEEGDDFPARNHFTVAGDVGTLVNVAGAGVLRASDEADAARQLVAYLLADEAQQYFVQETGEYPLVAGIEGPTTGPPIGTVQPTALDLSDLDDLEGTLELLRAVDVLP